MQTFWQDIRYAVRMLWKAPGFTAAALLALGLGIGANSAIFSAVDAFVLRPLPVEDHARVVALFETDRERRSINPMLSYPDYLAYRDESTAFSGLLAHRAINAALGGAARGGETGELIWGEMVSGNYFDVLGVRAARGRTFSPEEDRTPGTHPVIVVSHSLWQRRYNADPSIVGKAIALNGQPFTVIGVTPEKFTGTEFAMAADFWAPVMTQPQLIKDADADVLTSREDHWLKVLGRLKPDATPARAEANLSQIAGRLGEAYPDERSTETRVTVLREPDARFGGGEISAAISLGAGVAMAAVGLVLLIACANIANLLLARSAYRRKEIGVRLALGASRSRIVRQLLTESLLLALAGGALGLLIASWAANLLLTFMPAVPFRVALDFSPEARSVGWTFFVSGVAGLLFGSAPALQASIPDVVGVLKSEASSVIGGPGAKGRRRPALRDVLVIGQVALSLVVLVCGALFAVSLVRAQNIDPGFRAENAAALSLNPGLLGYGEEQGQRLYADLLRRVRESPGVASASITSVLPLAISHSFIGPVVVEGQAPPPPGEGTSVMYAVVGTRHFETLGIKLVAGRDFDERDTDAAPGVAIISAEMARRFYPGENPLGKRFRLSVGDDNYSPYRQVVGVVSDAKYRGLGESPQSYLYLPQLQNYTPGMTLVARANAEDGDLANRLTGEVHRLDPKLAVFDVKTLEAHLDFALWGPRTAAVISAAFGALALGLAALGLFGVMSYTVAQRTREIGVRLALGARHAHVLRLIVARGMLLTAIGVAIGLAGALAVTRLMSSLLYGVTATDPLTFVGVPLALAAVALVACYIPARRATRIDPLVALRYD